MCICIHTYKIVYTRGDFERGNERDFSHWTKQITLNQTGGDVDSGDESDASHASQDSGRDVKLSPKIKTKAPSKEAVSKSKTSKDNTEAADKDNVDAEQPDGTLVITKKRGVHVYVCVWICVVVCVCLAVCVC